MQIDLHTLYCLIVGTVLVAAATMLWERQAHKRRARELGIWAGAFLAFAAGLVVSINRAALPGILGSALGNLLIVSGYLMILHGVALLDGRARLRLPLAVLAVLALLWATLGVRFPVVLWTYVGSLPIALACGLTAWRLLRSRTARAFRARRLAIAVAGGHALFYLARALVTPVLVALYGDWLMPVFGKMTMYEGVLYSVAMPMGLIALVREEAQASALAAARTDYLTGLQNRHGFFEDGARLLDDRPRHSSPSTSTTSRRSTTATAMPPATRFCGSSPTRRGGRPGRTRWSPGSAARNSPPCCRASTSLRRGRSARASPAASPLRPCTATGPAFRRPSASAWRPDAATSRPCSRPPTALSTGPRRPGGTGWRWRRPDCPHRPQDGAPHARRIGTTIATRAPDH